MIWWVTWISDCLQFHELDQQLYQFYQVCEQIEHELSSGHSAPTSPDPYSEKIFDLPDVEVVDMDASEKKEPGVLDIIGDLFG